MFKPGYLVAACSGYLKWLNLNRLQLLSNLQLQPAADFSSKFNGIP